MFVLVTGGAGFIGSHSVERLLAAGARVRVFDNLSSGKLDNLPQQHPNLEVMVGDIRNADAVNAAFGGGITHVLHLAAQVSVAVSCERPAESASHNLMGFLNILEGARRSGVSRVVYASSAAVYGIPSELPLTENSRTAPISPYGLEKSINDQYAALYRELYGLSSLGMRFFNVYGPRQDPRSPYSGVISIFADRIRSGQPLTINGDGQQTRDFIYVGDIARANAAALGSSIHGVCNVATGASITLRELASTLAAVTGKHPAIIHAPPRTGDIRDSAVTPLRMRDELGIKETRPLEDGLRMLLDSLN